MKDTWGSHCDKLIFMSTEEDAGLGAIKLDVKNGKGGLWDKVRLASKHVFDNHFDDFDWFMKADDDTFVIVENLKEMLSEYDTNNPIMFGHPLKALGVSCDTMYYWHIHFLYYHLILSLVNYLV